MAVIKTYDILGPRLSHLWDGEQPEMTVAEAIDIIKYRREKHPDGMDYIGEKGVLDVDVAKIHCEVCRENLRSGAERR